MNLLNKLTIKNLMLNKKRTIVTIIGIILSVSLITAVASMYCSAVESAISFEIKQKGDFHAAFYDVPTNEIETFKNNREIDAIHLTKDIGYAELKDSKNEYKPYAFIKAFTKDSLENLSVKLVEGRLPENSNEIIIPTHLKTNGRITLNVGDTISLNVGIRVDSDNNQLNQFESYNKYDSTNVTVNAETDEILDVENIEKRNEYITNTKNHNYKIVGIIERPATNIEPYSAPGYTFITYMDENNLSGNVDVFAKFTPSGVKNNVRLTANLLQVDENMFEKLQSGNNVTANELSEINKEMEKAKYRYNINTYLLSLEIDPIAGTGVGGLGVVVVIVCIIIVVTSVFCIKNSFDISITEKIKQYGMLRSVGATKKQIRKNVFYEATVLGLIGIPLGMLAGFLASYILIIVSNYFLSDSFTTGLHLEFAFSWIAVIIAVLLGILTIYLSAIRSAIKAAKISPIDSIRNSNDIKINSKKIKSPKIINKLFGIGGEISFKNLKRNKKKYRTTVISIIISVAVFISLYSFMQLAFLSIKDEISIDDYNLTLYVNDKDVLDRALETLSLEGIKNHTEYRDNMIKLNNAKYNEEYEKFNKLEDNDDIYLKICCLGNNQYKKYVESLGLKYENMKDKAVLFDKLQVSQFNESKNKVEQYKVREFSYNKGDTIYGSIEDNDFKLQVGCITDELPFGIKSQDYSSKVIVSDELFDELITKYAQSNQLTIYYEAENASKLQDDIDVMLNDMDYSVTNSEENVKIMKNIYTLIGIFLYGFIIVISLIGITNIFNTITTNMSLRKQELAMLKSIGMTTDEFNRMIRLESIFMGAKSLFFGIPIGLILAYIMCYQLLKSGDYVFPLGGIVIVIIAVYLLITCIMKYSINKINKQNIIETIRNENI